MSEDDLYGRGFDDGFEAGQPKTRDVMALLGLGALSGAAITAILFLVFG